MSSDDNKTSQSDATLAVKAGIAAFAIAAKNYALYPETNPVCQNSLLKFKEWLDNFLLQQESLQLFVEKGCFLFQKEIVWQDKPGEQILVYPFFRDGVEWFEFLSGIPFEELRIFIILLNRFRILKEEAEDDLVTALWEANLLYIQYRNANEFWEIEPFIDLVTMDPGHGSFYEQLKADVDYPSHPAYEVSQEQYNATLHWDDKLGFISSVSNDLTSIKKQGNEFWELSPLENDLLKDMIFEEEHRNTTHDCLDILFILLTSQNDEAICSSVLNFVLDEIQYALSQEDFVYTHHFLVRLNHLLESPDPSKPWLTKLLLNFQKKIASPVVLNDALNNVWFRISTLTDAAMDELRQILLQMPPEVIHSLTDILTRTENARIENMLIEIIAVQICRTTTDMSGPVQKIKPHLLRQLIKTLKSQQLPCPPSLLIKLTVHESDLVQEEAIKTLLSLDSRHLVDIFPLIYNASNNIKHLLCLHIDQNMDPRVERLLLDYLRSSQKERKRLERDHVMDCYRALAYSTSPQGISFLQETLLKKEWRSLLGIKNQFHFHRTGAALALMLMPQNEEIKKFLETALHNSRSSISSAYWKAKEEINKSGKGRVL